jgi:4-aminobutyrate aminotransferase
MRNSIINSIVNVESQDNNSDCLYYGTDDIKISHGEGLYLYDTKGNRYIDCAAGTFNLSLGYSHNEVLDAAKNQIDQIIHVTSSFQTDVINDLAKKLVGVSPKNIKKAHPKVCSGSTANEGAIKIAQYHTGKRDVVSFFRSHLGQTMMMLSYSGNSFRREDFNTLSPGSLCVPEPYCYRCFYNQKPETCNMLCVERIYDFIKHSSSGQVACIMIEPITGNGGNIIPPARFFTELKKLCKELGIILIFDEIQTGIGRTGKMFASQYFEVEPDIITIGKGLGGSGFQIAAILTSQELGNLPNHHHSFTYGSNLLAAAAALKTLSIISKPEFLSNVELVGNYIMSRLNKLKDHHAFIGEVRGVGLMIGIEIVKPDKSPDVDRTNFICKGALKHGLILRSSQYGYGNVVKIRPALIITLKEAEELCDKLEKFIGSIA